MAVRYARSEVPRRYRACEVCSDSPAITITTFHVHLTLYLHTHYIFVLCVRVCVLKQHVITVAFICCDGSVDVCLDFFNDSVCLNTIVAVGINMIAQPHVFKIILVNDRTMYFMFQNIFLN